MPTRKSDVHRRIPRQERARVTVDAILEAAGRLLVEHGLEGTTTQRIADLAGVSIGSLYQYFPGKDAIVVELFERQSRRVAEAFSEAMARSARAPLPELTRELVAALRDAYVVNPRLYRVLLEAAPRLGSSRRLQSGEQRIETLLRSQLSRRPERLRPRDLDLAVFILVRAVRAAVWSAVIERPEVLDDPAFVDELSALALGFLVAPRP